MNSYSYIKEGRVSSAVSEGLERRYYLDFPQVLTLAEFAGKLREMRPFR